MTTHHRPDSARPRTRSRTRRLAPRGRARRRARRLQVGQAPGRSSASVPDDYRDTHPIAIEEMLATMDIPVGLDTGRLTGPRQVEHRRLRPEIRGERQRG